MFIKSDSSLDMTKHVTARFIRLVIVETNDVTASIKPITLNKLKLSMPGTASLYISMFSVKFYGCTKQSNILAEVDPKDSTNTKVGRRLTGSSCARDLTVASTDAASYRHFAVDTINTVIYFCDHSMHREGLACYSSADDGATWTGQ